MAADVMSRLGVWLSSEAKNFDGAAAASAMLVFVACAVIKNKAPNKASTFMLYHFAFIFNIGGAIHCS